MTLWAINDKCILVKAENTVKKRDSQYICKFCGEKLLFIDANLKVKCYIA